MSNRDLLKEAIADAKAVKEMAISNAKAALEEAFTPQLKSMLEKKLTEMDKEDDKEMEEAKMHDKEDSMEEAKHDKEADTMSEEELEELLAELEEGDEEEVHEEEEEPEADEEEKEEEEFDLEEMSEEDLKAFIEDVVDEMIEAGELEAGEEEMEAPEMEAPEEEVTDEEEVEEPMMEGEEEMKITERKKSKLNKRVKENQSSSLKLLDFVDGDNRQALDSYKKLGFEVEIDDEVNNQYFAELDFKGYDWMSVLAILEDCERMGLEPFMVWNNENYSFAEAMKLADEKAAGDSYDDEGTGTKLEAKSMKKELEEAYATLESVKAELNEVNLLNSKLLYTNKIFKAKNLSEAQKVKVLTTFDKAESVKEVKLVYETLSEGLVTVTSTPKEAIKESKSFASKAVGTSPKKPVVETDGMVSRFQKLAGIK